MKIPYYLAILPNLMDDLTKNPLKQQEKYENAFVKSYTIPKMHYANVKKHI